MDYNKFGIRMREFRKKRNISQEELAYEIEYSVPHISHVENGMTKPSVEFVVKVANALDMATDQLLCDSLENAERIYQAEIHAELNDCSNLELKVISQLIKDTKQNLRENL